MDRSNGGMKSSGSGLAEMKMGSKYPRESLHNVYDINLLTTFQAEKVHSRNYNEFL